MKLMAKVQMRGNAYENAESVDLLYVRLASSNFALALHYSPPLPARHYRNCGRFLLPYNFDYKSPIMFAQQACPD